MRLEVLSEAWLPPRLLFREDRVRELEEVGGSCGVVAVVGPSGVGKTTLVRMAFPRAPLIDCSLKRTYYSVVREAARLLGLPQSPLPVTVDRILEIGGKTVILDDYTLAKRTQRLTSLVKKLAERNRVVLVCHPSIKAELVGLAETTIEMPPYSKEELYAILEDRVVAGELPVSEEALEVISGKVGYPEGSGSARLAILILRKALELAAEKKDPEVLAVHVEAALKLLMGGLL